MKKILSGVIFSLLLIGMAVFPNLHVAAIMMKDGRGSYYRWKRI